MTDYDLLVKRVNKRRWKGERFFAEVNNFNWTVVRWEYHISSFHAFIQLAFTIILIRYLGNCLEPQ